jgi:antitoxin component of MazEF toxin-antitoxin module
MSNYIATVIKTGNSLALRIPKEYAKEANLIIGEKVKLPLATKQKQQNRERIKQLIMKLQEIHVYVAIADPTAWQREMRIDRKLPGRE